MELLGKRIKELRAESGLSQKELGERLGVSQDTVSLWETGKSLPSVKDLVELCLLFHVSADFLVGLREY